jgi:hypothetical protein
MKCDKKYHDAFGEEGCLQCFVRENPSWERNPFLGQMFPVPKLSDLEAHHSEEEGADVTTEGSGQ